MFVTTQHSQHDREAVISQGLRTRDHGPRTAAVGRSAAAYRLPPAAYRRRGVLLLVILSLLFMFVLIAVTYVLVTTRHLTISRQYGRMATTSHGQNPQQELDGALLQVLRGDAPTIDPATGVEHYRSPIGPHSLLEDLYGNTARFQLSAPPTSPAPAGGQLVELTAVPDPASPFTPRQDNGFYAGCVLTMTSGQAKGLSTRIVWSGHTNPTPPAGEVMFRVLPSKNIPLAIGDKFIINGRPFTGTGFGYNRETGRPDAMFDPDNDPTGTPTNSIPFALLPNPLSYDPINGNDANPDTYHWEPTVGAQPANVDYLKCNSYAPNNMLYSDFGPSFVPPFGGPGGANEDYDAVDYQNMAMAWVPPTPSAADPIIPSFHRQALVRYFANSSIYTNEWNPAGPDKNLLKRKVILRPIGRMQVGGTGGTAITAADADHPNFTGSSPNFDAVLGGDPTGSPLYTWDVDNDGDGVTDSVWLDLGAPVHSTADGRLYKPLFAILCIDLDGRVNVNAHGNAYQTLTTVPPIYPLTTLPDVAAGGPPLAGNMGGTLPVGSGFGPADVYPAALLTSGSRPEFMQRLLYGDGTQWEGRYGNFGLGGSVTAPLVGVPGVRDSVAALHLFQFPPSTYSSPPGPLTSFMTPVDVWGRRVVGLDFSGQPLFAAPVINTDPDYPTYFANETFDDPYELDLSASAPRPGSGAYAGASYYDNPFTIYELERILRAYDIDTPGLAPRLEKLIQTYLVSNPKLPRQLTTESFDIPMPPVVVPVELRDPLNTAHVSAYLNGIQYHKRAYHVKDLLLARLSDATGATLIGAAAEAEVDKMLSWDLRAGRRMNINRPLGDGRDGDGNDVVDEPTAAELATEGKMAAQGVWASAQGFNADLNFELTNGVDVNNDGSVNQTDQLLARQLMARHLYVLLMMLHNAGFDASWTGMPTWTGTVPGTEPDVTGNEVELVTRRIAQWAVNVVDFMDPDSIMTPFEYDENPWNGWNVDGVLGSADDAHPDRRLVWGCEAPALLLTETLAFHDRRVADTSKGSMRGDMVPPDDPDLDQVLIPQGSAFFELYCVGNPNAPVQPGDLYTFQGGQWYLDLERMAPPGNDGLNANVSYPVWRLAISAAHLRANSARNYAQAHPETASFEPQQGLVPTNPFVAPSTFSQLNPPGNPLDMPIERIVWFSSPASPPTNLRDGTNVEIYYARQKFNPFVAGTALLPGGYYAVVGPRPITPIGSTHDAAATQHWGVPSNHRIKLDAGTLATDLVTSALYPTSDVKPTLGIVAQAEAPTGWTGPPIGISVSEPLPGSYYAVPGTGFVANPQNPNTVAGYAGYGMEAYDDLTVLAGTNFLDEPLEKKTGSTLPVEQLPLKTRTATTFNHRTVFLQRLANPLAPYHPRTNPYLTVDWMPIDLTVFNGEDRYEHHNTMNLDKSTWDPEDNNSQGDTNNLVAFASRQRGRFSSFNPSPVPGSPDNTRYNLWSQWPDPSAGILNLGGEDPVFTTPAGPAGMPPTDNFRHVLKNDPNSSADNQATLGYLNHGYGPPLTAAQTAAYPQQPFPWLAWNNRPYNSVYELLQVPASSPGRLCWEFSFVEDRTGTLPNPYNNLSNNPATDPRPYARFPFRHALNFLASGNEGSPSTQFPNFCRILDYLEVPSPFVGTETILSPIAINAAPPSETQYINPPFCSVSNIRDPGRVNINTIASQEVWDALTGGTSGLSWTEFQTIRQGFLSNNPLDYPTDFSNPFRSYSAGDMVPRLNIPLPLPLVGSDVDGLRRRAANVGLLRAGRKIENGLPDNLNDPDDDKNAISTTALPAFMNADAISATPGPYHDAPRNSYFMYQGIDRLANLVTTHSNVYAVWVTVGYFEVTPAPSGYNPLVYPDGYQLGQELGMDTGDVDRHRAFYIIDRSIPVGFERGQNHNVEKAVLLRRFIE